VGVSVWVGFEFWLKLNPKPLEDDADACGCEVAKGLDDAGIAEVLPDANEKDGAGVEVGAGCGVLEVANGSLGVTDAVDPKLKLVEVGGPAGAPNPDVGADVAFGCEGADGVPNEKGVAAEAAPLDLPGLNGFAVVPSAVPLTFPRPEAEPPLACPKAKLGAVPFDGVAEVTSSAGLLKLNPPNNEAGVSAAFGAEVELEVPNENAGLTASSAALSFGVAALDRPKLNAGLDPSLEVFSTSVDAVPPKELAGLDDSADC